MCAPAISKEAKTRGLCFIRLATLSSIASGLEPYREKGRMRMKAGLNLGVHAHMTNERMRKC